MREHQFSGLPIAYCILPISGRGAGVNLFVIYLNPDCALKNFLGWAAKPDVGISIIIHPVELDRKLTAPGLNGNIIKPNLIVITYNGACSNAGSAGEGFVFNSSFISTYYDLIVRFLLYKIYIDSFFIECITLADLLAFSINVISHHIANHLYIVRRTRIQNKISVVILDLFHIVHLQTDDSIKIEFSFVLAITRLETIFRFLIAHVPCKFHEASSSIPTHTAFKPVAIIIFHLEVETIVII